MDTYPAKRIRRAGGSGTGSDPPKTPEKALAQTMAAWLNFAKGAIDLNELVDIGGGTEITFSDLMGQVEAILNNGDATKAEAVNKHDKDNSECDTGTGGKTGTKSGPAAPTATARAKRSKP